MFGKKKKLPHITLLRCPVPHCGFSCNDPVTLEKHRKWIHRDEKKEGPAVIG